MPQSLHGQLRPTTSTWHELRGQYSSILEGACVQSMTELSIPAAKAALQPLRSPARPHPCRWLPSRPNTSTRHDHNHVPKCFSWPHLCQCRLPTRQGAEPSASKRYVDLAVIGQGAYSVVASATDTTTGDKVHVSHTHPSQNSSRLGDSRSTPHPFTLLRASPEASHNHAGACPLSRLPLSASPRSSTITTRPRRCYVRFAC